LHFGPRFGIERCGKINASNSGSESWTGIGVVAGGGAVVLMMQWPHIKQGDGHWKITLLHILQKVRTIYKTRNQLNVKKSPPLNVKSYNCLLMFATPMQEASINPHFCLTS
jgi:hypothetical protein